MDFEELEHFIEHVMKMTHVYQPLMIKTLLESGGTATAEDIARDFLNEDKAQLEYYIAIAKRWPKITLQKHNVIKYTGRGKNGRFHLLLEKITKEQRERLIELLDIKHKKHIDKVLKEPWYSRRGQREHIPGQVRYDVLAKSGGVCVACGVSSLVRALEVDHIVPVNMGGDNSMSNLQALCYRCNAQKRDRDDTDFVMVLNRLKYRNPECRACMADRIHENSMAFAIRHGYPEAPMHSVVLPKRHTASFFALLPAEKKFCLDMIDTVKTCIIETDRGVTGFDVGFDAGPMAGDAAGHCGIHVIPRTESDKPRYTGNFTISPCI